MKSRIPVLALILLLVCTVSTNALASIDNEIPISKVTIHAAASLDANGPTVKDGICTVTGTVSIAKGDTFIGIGFSATDNNTLIVYPGVINLPKGPLTPGGAAVAFTGTSMMLVKGNYTFTVMVYYNDGTTIKTQENSSPFTVP